MWMLFLERMLSVLADGGVLSVVLPSGLLTNKGASKLRKMIISMKNIATVEFENRKKIFSGVDSRLKFVLITIQKIAPTDKIQAAFYQHDVSVLDYEHRLESINIPTALIKSISPESMAIPEFRTAEDINITEYVYRTHGRVKDGLDNGRYTIEFSRELDRTNDSRLFRRDGAGWPLVEGKNFHQFMHNYERPEFTVYKNLGLDKLKTKKVYGSLNNEIHDSYRLACRSVASSTNMRTMISCIYPPRAFFAHSVFLAVLHSNSKPFLGNTYYEKILYLQAIFNSFTFDYLLRLQTSTNLSFFIINNMPIPLRSDTALAKKLIKLSKRTTFINHKYDDIANALNFNIKKITKHERVLLIAEMDAVAAHCFMLTRTQYEHILSTYDFTEKLDYDTNAWDDTQFRGLQNEVKKHALTYYDTVV